MSSKLWIGLALLLTTITSAEETMVPSPLEFACEWLDLDCTGIEQPTVVYTNIMGDMGLYGAYFPGESIVVIDPHAPAHTVVHEVTHYVLHEAGFTDLDRCLSEEVARRVGDAWAKQAYTTGWKKKYGCV